MVAFLLRILTVSHRKSISVLLASAVGCVLAGGAAFAATQQVPFSTGLYWAVTTATTVGYGDVTPHNGAGRVVAVLVMLTAIPLLASVFALLTGAAAAAGVRRILAMRSHLPQAGYRLVIGMSPVVPAILEELLSAGDPVALVADVEPSSIHPSVHLVRGDPTQAATIQAARPQGAQQALITGASDGDVLVTAVLLRKVAPDLPVIALVASAHVREALSDLGIPRAVSGEELIARTLARSLEAPHAGALVSALMEPGTHRLAEFAAGPEIVGRPLSEIRDERTGLVLGLVRQEQLMLGIGDDPVIAAGDRLLRINQA